ncbi:hypothetical protein D1BOALGB6SA_8955 [Olavius sp. associated proteobacterium Delta 1]|nr:hypothetical protein D1BOALGB6SA_8955 [Olavius sp. associated proteobacterium Delta 1]
MKKATLFIWVIIFGFIALVIFQNQTFFLAKNAFRLNFGVREYPIPELYNAVILLVFFFSGLIIAYLFNFSARFKARRTIKKLNTTIASHINELAELKSEINTLKGIETPVDEQAETVKLDVNATQKIADESPAENSADKTLKYDAPLETANPAGDDEKESSDKKE